MKRFKLNMTRPEFFKQFLDDTVPPDRLTIEELETIIPHSSNLLYACYSCLMESNLSKSDIAYINTDDETAVVKLHDKSMVKTVKEKCNKEMLRLGAVYYKVKVKTDGPYFFVTLIPDHTVHEEEA